MAKKEVDSSLICVKALKAARCNHPMFGEITLVEGESYDLDNDEIERLIKDEAVERVKTSPDTVNTE